MSTIKFVLGKCSRIQIIKSWKLQIRKSAKYQQTWWQKKDCNRDIKREKKRRINKKRKLDIEKVIKNYR